MNIDLITIYIARLGLNNINLKRVHNAQNRLNQ
jgi:hypothetical protein